MSANVGTLSAGAKGWPLRWKTILIAVAVAATLTVGAFVLARPGAPAPAATSTQTAFVLPAVPITGTQPGSIDAGNPERARRKFGVLPTVQAPPAGAFVQRKWG